MGRVGGGGGGKARDNAAFKRGGEGGMRDLAKITLNEIVEFFLKTGENSRFATQEITF